MVVYIMCLMNCLSGYIYSWLKAKFGDCSGGSYSFDHEDFFCNILGKVVVNLHSE